MERNHDWPLISSKKTNPSHMLWFPSYLRGIPYRYTATFVNHRPITVKSGLPWSRVKTSVFSFFILFMDTKIQQIVQEKVDYCRCAQVNVIQKVRSVFRVKNILVRKGNWMWRSLYINIYLPQDIKPAPLQQPCLNKLVSPLFQPPEAMNVFS